MKLLERYNLKPLFLAHFIAAERGPARWISLALGASLPLAAGVAAFFSVRSGLIVTNGLGPLLSAVALLVGAMFGAFVFLTNLRVKVSESEDYRYRADLHRLIGSSAAGCLYVAGGALFGTAVLALVSSIAVLRSPGVKEWSAAIIAALVVHLGLTLIVTVRRLFAIYYAMFAADYDAPIAKSVSHGPRSNVTPHRRSA